MNLHLVNQLTANNKMTVVKAANMSDLDSKVVDTLRSMARRGTLPSLLLREIMPSLKPDDPDRPMLVRYFSEAFYLTEGEAYPIFGWSPTGGGELKDSDIDYLLTRRIQQTQAKWDHPSQ
jgi:hypothetical protein